jgi:hypothetical protein
MAVAWALGSDHLRPIGGISGLQDGDTITVSLMGGARRTGVLNGHNDDSILGFEKDVDDQHPPPGAEHDLFLCYK